MINEKQLVERIKSFVEILSNKGEYNDMEKGFLGSLFTVLERDLTNDEKNDLDEKAKSFIKDILGD